MRFLTIDDIQDFTCSLGIDFRDKFGFLLIISEPIRKIFLRRSFFYLLFWWSNCYNLRMFAIANFKTKEACYALKYRLKLRCITLFWLIIFAYEKLGYTKWLEWVIAMVKRPFCLSSCTRGFWFLWFLPKKVSAFFHYEICISNMRNGLYSGDYLSIYSKSVSTKAQL